MYIGASSVTSTSRGEFPNPRLVPCSSLHVSVTIGIGDDPGNRSGRHHAGPRRMVSYRVAPLAVFAVRPANYQRLRSRRPQKSWAADGSANDRTAASLAVLSLFWFETATMGKDNPIAGTASTTSCERIL